MKRFKKNKYFKRDTASFPAASYSAGINHIACINYLECH